MTPTISIRITPQALEDIAAAADLAGLSVSEFARRHRSWWLAQAVTTAQNPQIVTAEEGPLTAWLRLAGVDPADDIAEWRWALVRDAREILRRHSPPRFREVEGQDYIVEGE